MNVHNSFILTSWSHREVAEIEEWIKNEAACPQWLEYDLQNQNGSVQRFV